MSYLSFSSRCVEFSPRMGANFIYFRFAYIRELRAERLESMCLRRIFQNVEETDDLFRVIFRLVRFFFLFIKFIEIENFSLNRLVLLTDQIYSEKFFVFSDEGVDGLAVQKEKM